MKARTSEQMASAITLAQTARLFIIGQPGPLVFVLKEHSKEETVKVSLGSPHTCTCPDGTRNNYCVHISFLLQRKYHLPTNHPWLTRTSLTDADLEALLQMRHLSSGRPRRPWAATVESGTGLPQRISGSSDVSKGRQRNTISDLDACPICLEGFFDDETHEINYSILPFCSCCGNSLHTRCSQMYLQHARQTSSKELCPYCRSPFVDGRPYEKLESENRADEEHKGSEREKKPLTMCMRCEKRLDAIGIRRTVNGEKYCAACFITLPDGVYEKRGRKIIIKYKKESSSATHAKMLEFYRRFAVLQYREITMDDHNFLLELENPHMAHISRKCQPFPSYLVWNCFKQWNFKTCIDNQNDEEVQTCFLCEGMTPTFSKLLIRRDCDNGYRSKSNTPELCYELEDRATDDHSIHFETASVTLNTAAVVQLMLEQGEQKISLEAVQNIIAANTFLELPCTHVVHKICAVVGSLKTQPDTVFLAAQNIEAYIDRSDRSDQDASPPVSAKLSLYKIKMFPDYCTACKTPYLPEWIRGSKLSQRPIQSFQARKPPTSNPLQELATTSNIQQNFQTPCIVSSTANSTSNLTIEQSLQGTLSVTSFSVNEFPRIAHRKEQTQVLMPSQLATSEMLTAPLSRSKSLATKTVSKEAASKKPPERDREKCPIRPVNPDEIIVRNKPLVLQVKTHSQQSANLSLH